MKKILLLLSIAMVILAGSSMVVNTTSAAGLVPCGNGNYSKDVTDPNNPQGNTNKEELCTVSDLFKGVVTITNFLIAFAGVFAAFFIVRAGFNMVVSLGNQAGYAAAKKQLTNAILGMIIVLIAFVAVNTLISGPLEIGLTGGENIFKKTLDFINPNAPKP